MPRIVIAGCGFAGGAMALRSLQLGFEVILLDVPRADIGGVEIIPSSARHLLSELRLDEAFAKIRPGHGIGMLRRLDGAAPEFREGRALHVDRLALRRAVIAEAVSRGAEVRTLRQLPEPDAGAFASIDATGRRAAWSHPVRRHGRSVADVFCTRGSAGRDTALVVDLGAAWGYAAADEAGTTIGVIHDGRAPRFEIERAIRPKFGLAQDALLIYLGRRPAFPQSAAAPLRGRMLAIGDAAFSHDPIGGRGLSFALGSAFAAAAVLQTWRDHPKRSRHASTYYADYVAAEKRRHLAFISGDQEPAQLPQPVPSHVVWSATEARAPLVLEDGIDVGDVALTQSGTPVRWLSRFDVLELKALSERIQPASGLIQILCRRGFTAIEAAAMIDWALRNGLLRAAGSSISKKQQASERLTQFDTERARRGDQPA